MKKQALIMGIAVVLVLTAVVGGTIAAPTISANKNGATTINIEDMEVALAASTEEAVTEFKVMNAAPGYVADCPGYVVKNGTNGGYDLYARVTIDKQWVNGAEGVDNSLDANLIHIFYEDGKEISANSVPEGWILGKCTSEQIILYYTKPLKAASSDNTTTAFLSKVVFDSSMDNSYADKSANIEITTDAVQATIVETAMLSEWGVAPTVDANGVITAIRE